MPRDVSSTVPIPPAKAGWLTVGLLLWCPLSSGVHLEIIYENHTIWFATYVNSLCNLPPQDGGSKDSGIGSEGVKAALLDLTEDRVLALTGLDLC